MRPYLPDLHDSTTWEIPKDRVEEGKLIYEDAYKLLNKDLMWDIELQAETKVGDSLAVGL